MSAISKNLEQINESFVKLLVPLTPKELYKTIVEEALFLSSADYGSILLVKKDNSFSRVYSNIPKTYQNLRSRKHGNVYQTFRHQELRILAKEELNSIHPQFRHRKIKSVLLVPLAFNNVSIGVLSLQSKDENNFTQSKLKVLSLFSSLATLKIKNTLLLLEKEQALRSRDLFLSMASHELRTPLTTILGYSQFIRSKLLSGKPIQEKWVNSLNFEAKRLARLVNEFLDIDYIRTGRFKYQMTEFSLNSFIDKTIENFNYSYPNRVLNVINFASPRTLIYGDVERLTQAIQNFLNNAVKFSFPESPISLEASENKKNILLKVINKGKGIPKSELPNIFDNFYKGNSEMSGMGLGLFIAKNILEDHSGYIKVSSKPNRETAFTIILPKTADTL